MLNRLFDTLRGRRAAPVPAPAAPRPVSTVPLAAIRAQIASGDSAGACAALHTLANLHPQDADVLALYGWALFDLAQEAAARELLGAALRLQPDHPEALNTLGAMAAGSLDPEEAIAWFEDALEAAPGNLAAQYNLAQVLFLVGDYTRGFDLLRARQMLLFGRANQLDPMPAWRGENLAGKHLFVWCDWGGLGDHLQFIRYVALLRERARPARLTLGVGRELAALFATIPCVDAVSEPGHAPRADVHSPLLDLPHLFGTTIDSVPASMPYLAAPAAQAAQWGERLRAAGLPAPVRRDGSPLHQNLRIGLAWKSTGSASEVQVYQQMRRSKSVAAPLLAPLHLPGAHFVSLQIGADAAECAATGLDLIDCTAEITDFAATAAVIAQLDLVISADTSVAHLAGAMGKPVLLLLRRESGMFWLQGRDDSPWYPTMRILRQEQSGDWAPVIAQAAHWVKRAAAEGTQVVMPRA